MSELDFDTQIRLKQSVTVSLETKTGNTIEIVKTAEAVVPLDSTLTTNIILRGTKLERSVVIETEISIQRR
jgi:hypothetical protein